MNKNESLVSVIMPAFNSAETILDSIDSVLSQTYQNIELIICDDGSTDETLDLVYKINDNRVKVIKNVHRKGAAGARQSCLDVSLGKYIAFLDSDDIWDSRKIELQVVFMRSNNVSFSYTDYFTFRVSISSTTGYFKSPDSITFRELCRHCAIGCLTVMIDREKIDFYIIDAPKEDYATWLDILYRFNVLAYRCPESVSYYRLSDNSLSSNKIKELFKQNFVLNNIAKLNIYERVFYLMTYIFNGLIKKYWKY